MATTFKIFCVFLLTMTLVTCEDANHVPFQSVDESHDYILFGTVYGECTGDCRELYYLTAEMLYRDADQDKPLTKTLFNPTPLSSQDFQNAAVLLSVPEAVQKGQFDKSDLKQYIADFDYYFSGKIGDSRFEYNFDEVDSTANAALFEYANRVIAIYNGLE